MQSKISSKDAIWRPANVKSLLRPLSFTPGHTARCCGQRNQGRDLGGRGITHHEQEGVRVAPQLLHQALLQFRGGPGGLHRWEHLGLSEVQVPAEAQANHVNVLLAVAEGAGQRYVHWKGEERRAGLPCRHGAPAWPGKHRAIRATARPSAAPTHQPREGRGFENHATQPGRTLLEIQHLPWGLC